MQPVVLTGRVFFALALIGLGASHFIFDAFVTGRAPAWPASLPGARVWAWLTGALIIGIALCILFGRKAREAAVAGALLLFAWALLRHIPGLTSTPFLSGVWTSAGKALTFTGGMLVMAAIASPGPRDRDDHDDRFPLLGLAAGRTCLALFLLMTGVQHFMHTVFVASLIPRWFPGDATAWTFFAGVALIAGGAGMLVPRTARLAALLSGMMVFSWFWIVHLPRTFVGVSDSIAVFEALAVAGLAFVIAGALRLPVSRAPGITPFASGDFAEAARRP